MQWGYRKFCMLNLFAFRATDPRVMKREPDPVGPDNDQWLINVTDHAALVIAAWGNHGVYMNRAEKVVEMLGREKLKCLKMTGQGQPSHPLYLSASLQPVPVAP